MSQAFLSPGLDFTGLMTKTSDGSLGFKSSFTGQPVMQPKGVGCISEAAVESALAQEWGFPPDLSVREPVIFPWVQPDLEPRLNGTCAEGAVDWELGDH